MSKNHPTLAIACTLEERAKVREVAESKNMTPSNFVRLAINKLAGKKILKI